MHAYFITKQGKGNKVLYFTKRAANAERIPKRMNFGIQGSIVWECWSDSPLDRTRFESREEAEKALSNMLSVESAAVSTIREE